MASEHLDAAVHRASQAVEVFFRGMPKVILVEEGVSWSGSRAWWAGPYRAVDNYASVDLTGKRFPDT